MQGAVKFSLEKGNVQSHFLLSPIMVF